MSIDANHILNYFSDGENVFVIAKTKDSLLVQCLDPTTLKVITEFPAQFRFHPGSLPCVDDSCLYFSTFDGLLLSLDKFAGEKHWQTHLANHVITDDLIHDDHRLYASSVVPLCDGKQTHSDYRCLTVFDKETGKQQIQSNIYRTRRLRFTVDDLISILTESELTICDQDFCQINRTTTNRDYQWGPIGFEDRIVCASPGRLDVFSSDLKSYQYYVAPSSSPPLKQNGSLFWFAERGLYQVAFKNDDALIELVKDYPKYIFKDSSTVNDKLVAIRNDGVMVIWDGNNLHKKNIDRSADRFGKMIVVGKQLVIRINDTLFSIEVEP